MDFDYGKWTASVLKREREIEKIRKRDLEIAREADHAASAAERAGDLEKAAEIAREALRYLARESRPYLDRVDTGSLGSRASLQEISNKHEASEGAQVPELPGTSAPNASPEQLAAYGQQQAEDQYYDNTHRARMPAVGDDGKPIDQRPLDDRGRPIDLPPTEVDEWGRAIPQYRATSDWGQPVDDRPTDDGGRKFDMPRVPSILDREEAARQARLDSFQRFTRAMDPLGLKNQGNNGGFGGGLGGSGLGG